MATFDYDEMADMATELLSEFGTSASLIRQTVTRTDQRPITTNATYPITCVVCSYKKTEIDGERIMVGDKKIVISVDGLSITPKPDDQILFTSGLTFKIIESDPIKPADTLICHILQARA